LKKPYPKKGFVKLGKRDRRVKKIVIVSINALLDYRGVREGNARNWGSDRILKSQHKREGTGPHRKYDPIEAN